MQSIDGTIRDTRMTQDAPANLFTRRRKQVSNIIRERRRARLCLQTSAQKKIKHRERPTKSRLLDVGTVAIVVTTDPAFATCVTPAAAATFNTNRFLTSGKQRGANSFIAVNAYKMAAKVVLATERAPTRSLGAYVGLEPIWVMGRHVGLQIVSPSKCSWTSCTLVFLARVLCLIDR
jgi:hypothetical protein